VTTDAGKRKPAGKGQRLNHNAKTSPEIRNEVMGRKRFLKSSAAGQKSKNEGGEEVGGYWGDLFKRRRGSEVSRGK